MGGELCVDSKVGEGTSIWFVLTFCVPQQQDSIDVEPVTSATLQKSANKSSAQHYNATILLVAR